MTTPSNPPRTHPCLVARCKCGSILNSAAMLLVDFSTEPDNRIWQEYCELAKQGYTIEVTERADYEKCKCLNIGDKVMYFDANYEVIEIDWSKPSPIKLKRGDVEIWGNRESINKL